MKQNVTCALPSGMITTAADRAPPLKAPMLKLATACSLLLLTSTFPAHAAKEYTPEQLRQLVAAGKFPAQSNPVEESKRIAFGQCKAMVRSMMADVQPNYPVRTLLDSPAMLSMKVWTNDAAVVMSCSQDDRMVLQKSVYR
jgi:hypothetical protein